MAFLEIRNLRATAGGKEILKGLSLSVEAGQTHAIMGPNGAGKSTLAAALQGRSGVLITGGEVEFLGRDLLALDARERALAGLFLGYQHPVEVPGLSNVYFLKAALNAKRKHEGKDEADAFEFLKLAKKACARVGLPESFLQRALNAGLSGGEKKRNETLQLALLEPKLALLDEIDSGLDVDALKAVGAALLALRRPDASQLIITHYNRLLEIVRPDAVHLLVDGRVEESGGPELALMIEGRGYAKRSGEGG